MHAIEDFCCQDSECLDYGKRGAKNLKFQGRSGSSSIRMIRCSTCKARFSEGKGTVLWQCRLPEKKAISILEHIREGCGTRPTSRLVGVTPKAVTRLIRKEGVHSKRLHDELVAFFP